MILCRVDKDDPIEAELSKTVKKAVKIFFLAEEWDFKS